jgi:hypothetical protein
VADSINDGAGYYLPDVSAQVLSDAAAPIALSGTYLDTSANGTVDRVDVTFTEQVSMDECEPGDFTFTGADAGSIAVSVCTIPNDEDLRFTITGASGADTNLAFGLDYTAANGEAGSIDDTNNVASADFSIASVTDGAGPMLTSVSPVNAETNVGLTDDVVLNFTEPIDTGSLTYTFSEEPTGISVAWTGSNSIATISHTGSYSGMADITFTVTAAPDVAANTFVGAISGVTHPFTFTTGSAGSTGYTAPYTPAPYIPVEPESSDSEGSEGADEDSGPTDWNSDQTDYVPEVAGTAASPVTGEQEEVNYVEPGMFITGASFDTVYYLDQDLKRRPFFNHQIFFTWADSFDVIIQVTDATLSTLDLGSPILPQAGVVLVKIQSDPRVYVLESSEDPYQPILRWIQDEATAIALYGEDWADYIIDISPTLFHRFQTDGEVIDQLSDYDVDSRVIKKREELVN